MNRRSFLSRIAVAVAGAVVAGVVKVLPIEQEPRWRMTRPPENLLKSWQAHITEHQRLVAEQMKAVMIVTDVNAEEGVITFASLDDIRLNEQAHAEWMNHLRA